MVTIGYTFTPGSPPRRYGHPDDWHDGEEPEIEILSATWTSTGLKMPAPTFSEFLESHEDSVCGQIIEAAEPG